VQQIAVREALWFHGLFFAVAAPLLLLTHDIALGASLLWLVIGYNLAVPVIGLARGHTEWLWLWLFLAPLSIAQVLPDWALVSIAHTLEFPDLGQWRIGGVVPVYFMGMWITLLFPITLFANAQRSPYAVAGLLSLAAFGFWEWAAPRLDLWHDRDVATVLGVPLYALLPELLLGVMTLWAYRTLRSAGALARVTGAVAVSVFYCGALFIALVLERGWTV
jgi:hypothetical protein